MQKRIRTLAACLLAAACLGSVWNAAGLAMAQTPEPPPLSVYGALPAVEMVTLSPSGDRTASVTVVGEARVVAVTETTTGRLILGAPLGQAKARGLIWIGEDHVLALVSQTTSALGLIGGNRAELSAGAILDINRRRVVTALNRTEAVFPALFGAEVRGEPGHEILYSRAMSLGTGQANLFRIDPDTGVGRMVRGLDGDVSSYVMDARARIVALSEYKEERGRWSLKLLGGNGLDRENWSTTALLDPPSLIGLGRTEGSVLVSASRPDLDGSTDGVKRLFEVDLSTGVWTRLPVDERFDNLLIHPKTQTLIGVGRDSDQGPVYEFFDQQAAQRWASIARSMPDKAPRLASWSDDLKKVVVYTDTDGDAGIYQLVDFDRGRVDIIDERYPALSEGGVGQVRPVTYKAADGLDIHGFVTLPPGVTQPSNLPLVVLPHGGPQANDSYGFDWWAQAMASRGYVVLQPNFRGSTGYGKAFIEAGHGQWGRKMQTDLSDGVRYLASEGWIDPARVCIVGASYGGYAALAGPTLDPGVYRCAVAVAGVSDLRRMVQSEADQGSAHSQTVRYWNRFMGAERLGDRSLDERSPARLADRVNAPILMIHGRDDTVVPIEQSRIMADALRTAGKSFRLVELLGEDHWLSQAETRIRMLEETVGFLELHNPPD